MLEKKSSAILALPSGMQNEVDRSSFRVLPKLLNASQEAA